MGEQSAKGMAAALEDQTDPNKQLMRVGATRAVEGALTALEMPEQPRAASQPGIGGDGASAMQTPSRARSPRSTRPSSASKFAAWYRR